MGIFSFVKPGKKIYKTITSVKPNVPVTKGQKLKRDLKIATQKSKAAGAKLDNTIFRIKNKLPITFGKSNKKTMSNTELKDQADYLNKTGKYKVKKQKTKTKHFYAPENFNKGGRVGLRFGSKKSNVQKIKETFNPKKSAAKKKKFPDLTGDGKVTFADILKGRGVKRG